MTTPLLSVQNLTVTFPTDDGVVRAVDDVSFTLQKGRTLCLVGESGSGKSVTSRAILGLHGNRSAAVSGRVLLDGEDVLSMDTQHLRRVRGARVALVAQDSLSALHPYFTVGTQLVEAVRSHTRTNRKQTRRRAVEMLEKVGISQPDRRVDQYPHELSGGMRQRVMIAMALMNEPALVVADEPTTALDVTVQAQILDLLADLQRDLGMAILMVTHDLGVAAEIADDVLVMYAGRLVERGPVREIFHEPCHPYTWGLLSSMPRGDLPADGRLHTVPGQPPSLIDVPSGCAFHPRCEFTALVPGDGCQRVVPRPEPVADEHEVSCLLSAPARAQAGGADARRVPEADRR